MTPPVSTTNACRMCMPLGAVLAFAGIEKAVPLLHGGQGCATYIRRYLISHFNEPVDVASSSFAEADTVFGGESTLHQGIRNLVLGYDPGLVGVATTCLAETIGEDVPAMLGRLRGGDDAEALPPMVDVATPSYAGTHADGFRAAVAAVVDKLACPGETGAGETCGRVLLLPGILSPADLRHLREFCDGAGVPVTLLPDYGDSLDGPATDVYPVLRPGGTPLRAIVRAGAAPAAITLGGLAVPGTASAGEILAARFGTPHHQLPLPIGIRLTDRFAAVLGGLAKARAEAGAEARPE
ncbi:MAG: nitrogenase molybdenum-iron protein NifN, partial [Actinomycetota bacterium]|nr:nitrogenase molybdenum-iron protein NifN [Actinomycetota bacterium]